MFIVFQQNWKKLSISTYKQYLCQELLKLHSTIAVPHGIVHKAILDTEYYGTCNFVYSSAVKFDNVSFI